jgi:hypothetical protein
MLERRHQVQKWHSKYGRNLKHRSDRNTRVALLDTRQQRTVYPCTPLQVTRGHIALKALRPDGEKFNGVSHNILAFVRQQGIPSATHQKISSMLEDLPVLRDPRGDSTQSRFSADIKIKIVADVGFAAPVSIIEMWCARRHAIRASSPCVIPLALRATRSA